MQRPVVWDVLEEVITEHPVLLNRAPTLHRLGIQAFEPQLVEGKAIQIHPLVCTAFNADFDGDQMAVHVPLSAEAQAEARILMLSRNNILEPGRRPPITTPTQDMVLGLYHLTTHRGLGGRGEGPGVPLATPRRSWRTTTARCDLQAPVRIRLREVFGVDNGAGQRAVGRAGGLGAGRPGAASRPRLGRVLFNETLPEDYRFVNYEVPQEGSSSAIVNDLAERYPKVQVAATLDALKEAGFHWATRSGVTIAIDDVVTPPAQAGDPGPARGRGRARSSKQYQRGLITDEERRGELIEIWTRATGRGQPRRWSTTSRTTNPVWVMVNSGARGNMIQIRQIAGMRGLVANPKGEIIPRPIKANFREGLSVLEYFISTHGARKGLADTALRTADSGLPHPSSGRRLAGRHHPRGGLRHRPRRHHADRHRRRRQARRVTRTSRPACTPAPWPPTSVAADGTVVAQAGADLGDVLIAALIDAGVAEVKVRCVLTCESLLGTCATCYGRSLRDRQAGGRRRGGRHHRRPVDR